MNERHSLSFAVKSRAEVQRQKKAEAAKKQAKLIDQVRTDTQTGEMREALQELRKKEAEVKRQYVPRESESEERDRD